MYTLNCPICSEEIKVHLCEELPCPNCDVELYMDFELNAELEEIPGLFPLNFLLPK